jgi:hypothetical protein
MLKHSLPVVVQNKCCKFQLTNCILIYELLTPISSSRLGGIRDHSHCQISFKISSVSTGQCTSCREIVFGNYCNHLVAIRDV